MTDSDTTNSDRDSDTARAVSPVIGVVLLVAMTVMLAAVVGVQAITMIQENQPDDAQPWDEHAPNATFSIERIGGDTLIEHTGGDSVPATDLEIRGDVDPSPAGFSGQQVSEGDSTTVTLEGKNATVRVVWTTTQRENAYGGGGLDGRTGY